MIRATTVVPLLFASLCVVFWAVQRSATDATNLGSFHRFQRETNRENIPPHFVQSVEYKPHVRAYSCEHDRVLPYDLPDERFGHDRYFLVNATLLPEAVVIGTGIYSIDSAIASAAVHAGVIQTDTVGLVRLRHIRSYDNYVGSFSNKVRSQSSAKAIAGFHFKGVPPYKQRHLPVLPLFQSFNGRCFTRGEVFDVYVSNEDPGSPDSVKGTDIYSAASDKQWAGVHAGIMKDPRQNCVFTVTCLGHMQSFRGSHRYGVNSSSSESGDFAVALSSFRPLQMNFPGRVLDELPPHEDEHDS